MPLRQQRNTPIVQDLANTLDRLEIHLTKKDQVMTERDRATTERFNRVDTTTDELANHVRVNLKRAAVAEAPSLRAAKDITAGNRISRPSN
ncbi:hypothetical protein MFLAVUS_010245 [Mucor flavus]|uniref:Uncharacterized protein n=1 Tax=Mucor flavus TaxID=439312 RepID=A0ABP9ZC71_9FUNG